VTDVDSRLARAQELVLIARPAEAVPLLEDYLAEHPDDALGWRRLAGALVGTRAEDERAIAAAERAIALDPTDPLPHRHLAQLYLLTRGFPEMRAHARRATELDPDDPIALSYLAVAAAYADNDRKAARAMLARARKLPPDPYWSAWTITRGLQRAAVHTAILRYFFAAVGLAAGLTCGWFWFRPPGPAGVGWMLIPGIVVGVAAIGAGLTTVSWPAFPASTDKLLGAIVLATIIAGVLTWSGDAGDLTDAAQVSAATAILGLLASIPPLHRLRGR
jgi:uncharacterized protein HemY